MTIQSALEIADSHVNDRGPDSPEVYALLVLAGAYRREKKIRSNFVSDITKNTRELNDTEFTD